MRNTRYAWLAVAALALGIWGQPRPAGAQFVAGQPLFAGPGAYLGVYVRDLNADQAREAGTETGVVVTDVVDDSPAERAGVRDNDVIVEFDGERVRSAAQFMRLVAETSPERPVPLTVSRDGNRQSLTATLDTRRAQLRDDLRAFPGDRLFEMPLPRLRRGDRIGTTLQPLNEQLAEYFGVKEGVLVSSVAADSAAARAGLKAGDVITAVNGRGVRDPNDVRDAMRRGSGRDALELQITRDKQSQTIRIPAS